MRISGVMIGSQDPDKLGEYYTKVLGNPGWRQDNWYGFGDKTGSIMVGPHSEVVGTSKEPARLMIFLETNEVKAEFERIKAIGGTSVIAEPYLPSKDDPEMWLATLADPDGNYIQLAMPWKE